MSSQPAPAADFCEAVRAELNEVLDIEKASAAWDPSLQNDAAAALDVCIEAMVCRASEMGWQTVPDGVPPRSAGRQQCIGKRYATVELRLLEFPHAPGRNRFEYRTHRVWIGGGALAYCAFDDRLGAQIVTVLGQPVHAEGEALEAFRKLARHHAPDLEPLVRGGYRALRLVFDPFHSC